MARLRTTTRASVTTVSTTDRALRLASGVSVLSLRPSPGKERPCLAAAYHSVPMEPAMEVMAMKVMPVEVMPMEAVTMAKSEGEGRTVVVGVIRVAVVAVCPAGKRSPIGPDVPVPPTSTRPPAAPMMQAVHFHHRGSIFDSAAACG
jgi:hypothetical protein